jgi:hypothetical protein
MICERCGVRLLPNVGPHGSVVILAGHNMFRPEPDHHRISFHPKWPPPSFASNLPSFQAWHSSPVSRFCTEIKAFVLDQKFRATDEGVITGWKNLSDAPIPTEEFGH